MNGDAVCFDAYHALAVKGTPGALTFLASNGEVTTTNDRGVLGGSASAFHLPGVPRIELQGTNGPVQLLELYGNNAAASVLNETLDEGSFVGSDESAHGRKKKRGSRLVEGTIV